MALITEVRSRIADACRRVGRSPDEVTLVAVSKGHNPDEIREAILSAGHTVLGENRIQEWRAKAPELPEASWHFIGNLQRNKAKYSRQFALIHSLNSARLADALQAVGERHDHLFRVLIEVNVAGEMSKQGVALEQAEQLADYVRSLDRLAVEGVMTMAPFGSDPEQARRYFTRLRTLRDKLGLVELSMGMSGDFEVAVEEGATIVRIGSALFERPKEAPPA